MFREMLAEHRCSAGTPKYAVSVRRQRRDRTSEVAGSSPAGSIADLRRFAGVPIEPAF